MWLTKPQPARRAGQMQGQEPLPAASEQQLCMWTCLDHNNISGLCKVLISFGGQEKVRWQTGLAEADLPDLQWGPSWLFSLSYPVGTI